MATQVIQINPLDLQPSVGIGVSIPFTNSAVFNTTYTTQDALKTNLINYILTGTNERYLNPEIGTGIREQLFNQSSTNTVDNLEQIIRSGISTWFPRIQINNLTVEQSPDTNTLTLYLRYSVRMTNIEDELIINFEQ